MRQATATFWHPLTNQHKTEVAEHANSYQLSFAEGIIKHISLNFNPLPLPVVDPVFRAILSRYSLNAYYPSLLTIVSLLSTFLLDGKMLGFLKIGVFTIIWLPLVSVGLYALCLTLYRLFLSPLAKFPGPKLAALTRKYESYYEAIENYEYLWKIKQMHQKYGELFEKFGDCSVLDFLVEV